MNYLVVVAHPDDEVLGAGATINKFIKSGHRVAVAIMVGKADARKNLSATLADDEAKAMSIMGVEKVFHADFPNIKMNRRRRKLVTWNEALPSLGNTRTAVMTVPSVRSIRSISPAHWPG